MKLGDTFLKDYKADGSSGGEWSLDADKHPWGPFNNGAATYIMKTFGPNSILEFGCGAGQYCSFFSDHGASVVHGIEPNPMGSTWFNQEMGCKQLCFDVSKGESHPKLLTKYDLLVTIEVMEHVALDRHGVVFDFFKSVSPRHIVFSGARVGQEGHGHIACRPEEEWREEVVKRGFKFDPKRTLELRAASNKTNPNHCMNLQVFNGPRSVS